MKKFTKIALIVASFVLVAALSVGGTMAWLTAQTTEVKNTFSPTNIEIVLHEHPYVQDTDGIVGTDNVLGSLNKDAEEVTTVDNYQMVPGVKLPKDPFIEVAEDSEPCYVYIEATDANNDLDADTKYITYEINSDWTELTGVTGKNGGKVYYYKDILNNVAISPATTPITETSSLIANELVSVSNEITNDMTFTQNPQLIFYGYAIQAATFSSASAAWTAAYGTGA